MRRSGRDVGPPFGDARGDQPALDEVAQADLLLDALAARTESDFGDPDDFEAPALAALLGDWRDDLRWPPASALVSQDEAEDALRYGMSDSRRSRRGLAAVGSVAATLLMLSGFGAVVADAKPGDLLYGLHAMMFNEPRVSDDQIVLSAKADLAKVEQMIAAGQWDQAHTQLAEVSSTLQTVNDGDRRQGLLDEVNQLTTKVEQRDPKATVRPASPPTTELVVPSAPANTWTPLAPGTELPPPVAIEAPTSPEVPEPNELTSPAAPPTPPTKPPPTPPPTLMPTPTNVTTPATEPPAATTTPNPKTSTTTPTTSQPPSPSQTTTKGKPKPSTTGVTPNSPAAGPNSPAPSTPSGELWDRTSRPPGPSMPRTTFPTSPGP